MARLKNMLVCRHPIESKNTLAKKKFFDAHSWKTFFSHKYFILAMEVYYPSYYPSYPILP